MGIKSNSNPRGMVKAAPLIMATEPQLSLSLRNPQMKDPSRNEYAESRENALRGWRRVRFLRFQGYEDEGTYYIHASLLLTQEVRVWLEYDKKNEMASVQAQGRMS